MNLCDGWDFVGVFTTLFTLHYLHSGVICHEISGNRDVPLPCKVGNSELSGDISRDRHGRELQVKIIQ